VKLGRVDHEWHTADLRVRHQQVHKLGHGAHALNQAVVHVDVQDVRALLHLLNGNVGSLLVVTVHDRLLVHDGARYVAALADVQEGGSHVAGIGVVVQRLQATDAHHIVRAALGPHRVALGHLAQGRDVLRASAAAAADAIQQAVVKEGLTLLRHLRPLLVVPAHGVGQASVGVAEHPAVGALAQIGHEGLHVLGAQRTVQADGKRLHVAHAVPEGLIGLAAQGAPRVVHNGAADHHRDAQPLVVEEALQGVHRSLGV